MSDSFKSTIAHTRVAQPAQGIDKMPANYRTEIAPISPPSSSKAASVTSEDGQVAAKGDVNYVEDYSGQYKFAPIKEWEVSRAMTSRYYKVRLGWDC